jgi:hypothetical protein
MLITSMGIFGFLSKAHSEQGLVSGEVLSKLAVYDEKIKTSKENIDVNRRALKQMDEAVDQVMGRSTSEAGADKAIQIRRSQAKERQRLLSEIETEQKRINQLTEEKSPIAAEVRKVEAEVGPIKYVAAFIYGNTDPTILEKAVTWMIVTIIIVFDPLAIILLLASQISFQRFRENQLESKEIPPVVKEESKPAPENIQLDTKEDFDISKHPYLFNVPTVRHPPGIDTVGPQVYVPEKEILPITEFLELPKEEIVPVIQREETKKVRHKVFKRQEVLPEEPMQEEAPIIQQEEIQVPVVASINPEDYKNISQDKLDEKINEYAQLVREKKIDMTQVPKEILLQVRAKV